VTKTGILIREAHAAHEMSRKTATGGYRLEMNLPKRVS